MTDEKTARTKAASSLVDIERQKLLNVLHQAIGCGATNGSALIDALGDYVDAKIDLAIAREGQRK